MPWNNSSNGSGSGGPKGPWNRGPTPGGGMRPPDIEEMLRRSQDRLRRFLPGPGFTTGSLVILLLIVAGVWLASGIYFVGAFEQGIVLRFGRFVARTPPGINYHLPWPIETAYTLDVTRQRQINIGYRTAADTEDTNAAGEELPAEADMLTGDENIIDINFVVFWRIKDAQQYLFSIQQPEVTVKDVAESAMRDIVGQSDIQPLLTGARQKTEQAVQKLMQAMLDSYSAGISIDQVQLQKVDPPAQVIDAFRDVQAARADKERLQNEAGTYANRVVPEARGEAERILQAAQAYKQQTVAEASGQTARFLKVYEEYKKAPEVTRKRIYLETMERVLGGADKTILDSKGGEGVVPYLYLDQLRKP
jgi:modulator of FtsH protease HflK